MAKRKGCLPLATQGKKVSLRFRDHAINDSDPVECEIDGFIEKVNDDEIIVRWWTCYTGKSLSVTEGDGNNEVARVLQGTLIWWQYYAPKKRHEVG